MLSITEVLEKIDQLDEVEKFYVSFDNIYSSHVLTKKDKFYFLDLHRSKEAQFKSKKFYNEVRKNYFCQINNITVNL